MITRSLRFADLLRATTRTKQRLLGATVVALLVVSGCSSEQSASTTVAPAVTEETTTSAAPSSTEGTTSTTAPPASETTTTAAPPTTATPEPTVATTTGDQPDQQLKDAVEDHTRAWITCVSQAPVCDLAALAETRSGEQLKTSQEIASGVNTNGWVVSNIESYRAEAESVETISGNAALVTVCTEDGLVVKDRNGEIVNDEFYTTRRELQFERIDGRWKVVDGVEIARTEGTGKTLCSF